MTTLAALTVLALLASPLGFWQCCCVNTGAITFRLRETADACRVSGVLVTVKDLSGTVVWTGTTGGTGEVTMPADTLAAGTYTNATYTKTNWFTAPTTGNGTFTVTTSAQTVSVVMWPNFVTLSHSQGSVSLPYSGITSGSPFYLACQNLSATVVDNAPGCGRDPCAADGAGTMKANWTVTLGVSVSVSYQMWVCLNAGVLVARKLAAGDCVTPNTCNVSSTPVSATGTTTGCSPRSANVTHPTAGFPSVPTTAVTATNPA